MAHNYRVGTTATLDFVYLDTQASIIEAASKRVRLALLTSGLVVMGGVGCYYLRRAKQATASVRGRLSSVEPRTDGDRECLKDIAISLGQSARALSAICDDVEQRKLFVHIPFFGAKLHRHVEDLACMVEDMAETAALAASTAFTTKVRQELRDNLQRQASA